MRWFSFSKWLISEIDRPLLKPCENKNQAQYFYQERYLSSYFFFLTVFDHGQWDISMYKDMYICLSMDKILINICSSFILTIFIFSLLIFLIPFLSLLSTLKISAQTTNFLFHVLLLISSDKRLWISIELAFFEGVFFLHWG